MRKRITCAFIIASAIMVHNPASSEAYSHIRMAMYEVPGVVEPNTKPESLDINGALGLELRKEFRMYVGQYNATMVWVKDGAEVGMVLPNGTATGMLGLIQHDKADILAYPLGFEAMAQVFTKFTISHSLKGVFGHRPVIGNTKTSIVSNTNVYPSYLIAILILVTSLLGLCLTKQSQQIHTLFSVKLCYAWQLNMCHIKQIYVVLCDFKGKVAFCIFMIACLFNLTYYSNVIQSDMVAADFSMVVDSIDDFYRIRAYSPLMTKYDELVEIFSRSSQNKYKDVWQRASETPGALGSRDMQTLASLKDGQVFIGNEIECDHVLQFACMKERSKQIWISHKPYGETMYALTYGSRITGQLEKHAQSTFQRAAEGGVPYHSKQFYGQKLIRSMGGTDSCFRDKLDDLLDSETPIGSGMNYMKGIFVFLIGGLLIAFVLFVCERSLSFLLLVDMWHHGPRYRHGHRIVALSVA